MVLFLVDLDSRRGEKHVDQLVTQGAYSGVKHFIYGCFPENRDFYPPNHLQYFNRLFHYFHHLFWGGKIPPLFLG